MNIKNNLNISPIKFFSIIIAVIPIIILIYNYFNVFVWRHDSLLYIDSFKSKLETEGRWITYLFFEQQKSIPPHLGGMIQLFCIGIFAYQLSFIINQSKFTSFLLAILVTSVPINVNLMLWPVTSIIAFIYLAFTPEIRKNTPRLTFFCISGVIFFGTMSNYYFLLPLLYLNEFNQENESNFIIRFKIWLTKLILPWVLGFIIGYLVSNLITYVISGELVTLADWRKPNPINSIHTFIENLSTIFSYLIKHVEYLLTSTSISLMLLMLVYLSFTITNKSFPQYLTIIAVIFSIYISTIYHGILISLRTTIPLWVGFVSFFLLNNNKISNNKKAIGNLIITLAIYNYSYIGTNNLLNFNKISSFHRDEIIKTIPKNNGLHQGVILVEDTITIGQLNRHLIRNLKISGDGHFDYLGNIYFSSSAFREFDFSRIKTCTKNDNDDICIRAKNLVNKSTKDNIKENFYTLHNNNIDNMLVISTNNIFKD